VSQRSHFSARAFFTLPKIFLLNFSEGQAAMCDIVNFILT